MGGKARAGAARPCLSPPYQKANVIPNEVPPKRSEGRDEMRNRVRLLADELTEGNLPHPVWVYNPIEFDIPHGTGILIIFVILNFHLQ